MTADKRDVPPPVLAVGGSAGSLAPLLKLVRALPGDFPAAVLVTTHLGDTSHSRLPEILGRHAQLPAAWACDGDGLQAGRVYVAPPGFHLLVRGSSIELSNGPRVNRHRPSVDAMLTSVAESVDGAGVAVVLSGALDDGAVGAALVAAAGGEVLVEDPRTAEFTGMPRAVLRAVAEATVLTPDALAEDAAKAVGRALDRLAEQEHEQERRTRRTTVEMDETGDIGHRAPDEDRLTRMVCPECGGSLAQVDLAQISYFRCHVGHQYGPDTLAAAQAEASEMKLWSAVAALEEESAFQAYLATSSSGSPEHAASHQQLADEIAEHARQLREQVRTWTPISEPPAAAAD